MQSVALNISFYLRLRNQNSYSEVRKFRGRPHTVKKIALEVPFDNENILNIVKL